MIFNHLQFFREYSIMNFYPHSCYLEQLQHNFASDSFFSHLQKNSQLHLSHIDHFFELQPIEHYEESPQIKPNQNIQIQSPRKQQKATIQQTQKPSGKTHVYNAATQKKHRKRKIKPSPYHNFQKHLKIALKHLFLSFNFDQVGPSSNITVLAHQIWKIFVKSQFATKKMLHFIFNQYNQLPIKQSDLKELGLQEIYRASSSQQLRQAKTYLTRMAINHLTDENIDNYLKTRRIKNISKFKKYIQLFRQQLVEGFIKKRFTNRSRKIQGIEDVEGYIN